MNIQALLTGWVFEPAVILGIAIAGLMYWRGVRYSAEHGLARRHRWWHSLAFTCGLLVVLIALESPIDTQAGQLFWVHMLQHELLMLVAAPLLLLGAPFLPLWRSIPLRARRTGLSWALKQGWPVRIGTSIAHFFRRPLVAWLLFVLVFSLWHVPALYDLALEQPPIHVLEHGLFLGSALLFWAQIIPSWPVRRRLSYLRQALFLGAAAVEMNLIAAFFMYSTGPIYPYYAALSRPAGAISVVVDQHFAGAVMDVPGTVLLFVAISALLALWLREDERAPAAAADIRSYAGAGRWGVGGGSSASEAQ
jgi:cytochrome c oxidase assembly factor CtaG